MSTEKTYRQALQFHQQGLLQQAEIYYQKTLSQHPQHADALHYLGVIYYQTNQSLKALELINSAVKLNPRNADMLNNQGLVFKNLGQLNQALESFEKALKLNPSDSDIHLNLANLYQQLLRFEEAAGYYRRVLRAQPHHLEVREALLNAIQSLGGESHQSGRYAQAEACYQESIKLAPEQAFAHYNLGNAQRELGKTQAAIASYQTAIQLDPHDADSYNNLGNVLREVGHLQEAMSAYETALRINPSLYHAKVHLVHQKQHVCDWNNLNAEVNTIRDWVTQVPNAQISPFAFLAMPQTSLQEQLSCANNWLKNRYSTVFEHAKQQPFDFTERQHSKLRIGYLSADFRLHPLAFLISELIETHDRTQFEIYAYSYGVDDQTPERKRLANAFDHFVDIRAMSLEDAAKRIYADEIDILVDLTGFTQTSRTQLVALRPAPISVNWLGFPGTMGAYEGKAMFDYLMTDKALCPPEFATFYAEKLAYLPHTYQPNDTKRNIASKPDRAKLSLPAEGFVYCCFNQTFKILPEVFNAWLNILKTVPNSVLWLLECNPIAKSNLLKAAAQSGIHGDRLIFAPRVSQAQHLARQQCADLFLDTLPYNAHTTASDALWVGLPVLTMAGETFASRVASSLLKAVGLDRLICHDLQTYEAIAINLAINSDKLKTIKQLLLNNQATHPLFNMPQFTQNLEVLYQQFWQSYWQK